MLLVVGNAATADAVMRVSATPNAQDVGVILDMDHSSHLWKPGGSAPAIAIAAAAYTPVRIWHPLPAAESDPVAALLHAALDEAGVDTRYAPVAGRTVRAFGVDSPTGRLLWSENPIGAVPDDVESLLNGVTHIVFAPRWGSWSDLVLEAATARNVPVSFIGEIPATQSGSWSVGIADHRQFDDADDLTVDVTVRTRGDQGSTVTADGEETRVPAERVDVVDSTGAGDVFGGSLIGAIDAGSKTLTAARLASSAAALQCTRRGALPQFSRPLTHNRKGATQ